MANPVNPQEMINVAATGMVYALVVNTFASSLGILMAGAELAAPPIGQTPTEKGIADLKETFGSTIVNKAVLSAGEGADIVQLAMAVEGAAMEWLTKKYGSRIASAASQSCAPMDWRCVKEVAQTLYDLEKRGLTPETHPIETVEGVSKAKARGRRVAQPVKDTKTGTVYRSKASAGMAVASEYGLDPKNHFIWYEVIKKDPDRFVRA